MPGNNILLQRFPAPKWVHLPNGCVIFAKYQRFGRHALTPTRVVKISRTYVRKIGPRKQRIRKIGPTTRRQQADARLDLSTAIDLGRKAAGPKLGKMMINDALDYIPMTYKKIRNKITNKKVEDVIDTGVNDYLVNKEVELTGECFN